MNKIATLFIDLRKPGNGQFETGGAESIVKLAPLIFVDFVDFGRIIFMMGRMSI